MLTEQAQLLLSGVLQVVPGQVFLSVNVTLDIVKSLLVGDRFVKVVLCGSTAIDLFSIAMVPTTCEAKSEGLVRYPTTLAPVSGSVTVTTQCADNAHTTSGSSLSVRCASGGRWPGPVPQCECNEGYTIEIVGGKKICQGLVLLGACAPMALQLPVSLSDWPMCQAKSEGLVRYPTTLAPVSGSVTVPTQCADNAHSSNSTSSNITCSSSGSWSVVLL